MGGSKKMNVNLYASIWDQNGKNLGSQRIKHKGRPFPGRPFSTF